MHWRTHASTFLPRPTVSRKICARRWRDRIGRVASGALAGGVAFLSAIAPSGTGYQAKTLCSAVFVSGRDAESVRAQEFEGLDPLMGLVDATVDRDRHECWRLRARRDCRTRVLLVVEDGRLIAERYANGFSKEMRLVIAVSACGVRIQPERGGKGGRRGGIRGTMGVSRNWQAGSRKPMSIRVHTRSRAAFGSDPCRWLPRPVR